MANNKRNDKKKKTRRSDVDFPNLDHNYMPRNRREYVDYDYVDTLSEEEKKWLDDFSSEYYGASVKGKDRLHENKFHNTEVLKKSVTDANNARNRDMYGIAKASNLVHDDLRPENDVNLTNYDLFEDAMIAEIDEKYRPDYVYYSTKRNIVYVAKDPINEEFDILLGEF